MFESYRKNIFIVLSFIGIVLGVLSGCSSNTHSKDSNTSEVIEDENMTMGRGNPTPVTVVTPLSTPNPTPICTPTPTPTCTPTLTPIPTPIGKPSPSPTEEANTSGTPTPNPNTNAVPPLANDDNVHIDKNDRVLIAVLDNDSDSDGFLLVDTIHIVTLPIHGSVEIKDGKILYISDMHYTGKDSFRYTVKDNDGMISDSATVTIIIQSTNHTPIAQPQSLTTLEETNLSITLSGSDEDNDTLTYKLTTQPTHGTLKGIVPNLTYVPNANYHGTDSFNFMVNDGKDDSSIAKIDITVTGVNDAPVAIDDSVSTEEDTQITIDVLSNDSDMDGTLDPSTLVMVRSTTHGIASVVDGKINYKPQTNYYGTDRFTYAVKDNEGLLSNEAEVTITIGAKNDAPTAQPQSLTTPEETDLSITLSGSDEDNDILTYQLTTHPTYGTLKGIAPNLTYVPNANYHGTDSFNFMVNDGKDDSNIAKIDITVTGVNDAPVAIDDSVSTEEDTPIIILPLTNDYDLDGNNSILRIISVSDAEYGSVLLVENKVYYAPRTKGVTHDHILYRISDEYNATDTATIYIDINVTAHNNVPVGYSQLLSTPEDTEISIDLNGSDPDGDSISYILSNTSYVPAHGTLSGTAPHVVYHPQKDFFGEDYIVFTTSDGQLESSPAVITIRVIPRNDPPVADAGEDYQGIRGDLVHFDGSGSYDVDGNITNYVWKEGNTTLSTQSKFDITMLDEGIHKVTLTVTDDQNITDSDEKMITINPCCKGCNYPDPTATNPFN